VDCNCWQLRSQYLTQQFSVDGSPVSVFWPQTAFDSNGFPYNVWYELYHRMRTLTAITPPTEHSSSKTTLTFVATGVKPSAVAVNLRYRGKKLTYLDYGFATPVLQASSQVTYLTAEARIEEVDSRYGLRPNYYVGYSLRPSSIAGTTSEGRFGAVITSRATDEERNAAFKFDLSCLSSLRGCQVVCEIMPSAWNEAVQRSLKKEISLPDEWLENPRCSRH